MLVEVAFTITGALIIVGFLANYFFDRIKIPDALILMLIGILLGPVANTYFPDSAVAQLFNPSAFLQASGFMASLAILMIMFQTGLTLDIKRVLVEVPKSFAYATIHYTLTAAITAVVAHIILGWSWLFSWMLGFLLGGTSAAVVIPLASRIGLNKEEVDLVELESTITNVYNLVLVMALAQFVVAASTDWKAPISSILSAFSIAIVVGAVFGYLWAELFHRIERAKFSYMVTFAVTLLLYAFVEAFGGNGALAVLVFGVVMANHKAISAVRLASVYQLHSEITFFIRVFFFVLLGVIFQPTLDIKVWALAITISAASYFARLYAGKKLGLEHPHEVAILLPRGLGAAVISALLLQMFDSTVYESFAATMMQVTSITILWTNVLASILVYLSMKQRVKSVEEQAENVAAASAA